tara:strand:+ start:87 stop:335 length:249 start_codon:yes stop_codon:yes gene_type:complete
MNKAQIKKEKVKKVINYLIDEFDIHTIERENQYLNFWYKDDITGSLDTRGFDIFLTDDNYSSHEDEDIMQEKVDSLLKSLNI